VRCRSGLLDPAGETRRDIALFGEAQSRVVVSLAPADLPRLKELAAAGVSVSRLGEVGGDRLVLGPVDVSLAAAQAAWSGGLADALAGEG
jgi:hypothetical protein